MEGQMFFFNYSDSYAPTESVGNVKILRLKLFISFTVMMFVATREIISYEDIGLNHPLSGVNRLGSEILFIYLKKKSWNLKRNMVANKDAI